MFKRIAAVALLLVGPQALAADAATEARIRTAIQDLVQGTQIESIADARVPGFYEVTLGGQVVYVSSDGKYLLSGALWDVAAKKNLTDARYAEIRKAALESVGKDKRIARVTMRAVSPLADFSFDYQDLEFTPE